MEKAINREKGQISALIVEYKKLVNLHKNKVSEF